VLAQIRPGLATPVAGIRWLTEVEWTEPYTGPIPLLAETGPVPIVIGPEQASLDEASPSGRRRRVGSIWDALDETAGIPILSRAALWRRDAVERRAARRDGEEAISA
jgi:hypothetical protein